MASKKQRKDEDGYKDDPDDLFEVFRVQRYRLLVAHSQLTPDEVDELECLNAWVAEYVEALCEDTVTIRQAAAHGWGIVDVAGELRRFDASYTERTPDYLPTAKPAGTADRIDVMASRVAKGAAPRHPRDPHYEHGNREVVAADRRENGRDVNRKVMTLAEWTKIEAEAEAEDAEEDYDEIARRTQETFIARRLKRESANTG